MLRLLTRIFAVIGVLAFVTSLLIGLGVWYWMERATPSKPHLPESMILTLDLTRPIADKPANVTDVLSSLVATGGKQSLIDVVSAIDAAKDDPHVKGIVARFGAQTIDLATTQDIRDALLRFRASGKFSYAFATSYGSFGGSGMPYYLASAFDSIWLQPVGSVSLPAGRMELPYAKSALQSIGVTGDFMHRENYKSFMDKVMRDSSAPEVRANMQSLLNDVVDQEITGIATARAMPVNAVRALAATGPFTAEEALTKGLVSRVGYWDEMINVAMLRGTPAPQHPGGPTPSPARINLGTYLAYQTTDDTPAARIAYITANGMIVDAPNDGLPMPLRDDGLVTPDAMTSAFAAAVASPSINAILFRIDSPGGSPEASETIRRALIKARKAGKPVFVSMGSMAASGGYWLAMDADTIVAAPGTVTGSIGVVAGKFVLGDLWKKLGIHWDTIATDGNHGLWSSLESFSPTERARMDAMLDATYGAFTANVAAARHLSPERLKAVTGGRVFTGRQAKDAGLVDELGGLYTTVELIRKHLKLKDSALIELEPFPPPATAMDLVQRIVQNLEAGSAAQASLAHVLTVLQPVIGALGLNAVALSSPVTAMMPDMLVR